jgi:hypothetical protein
MGRNMSELAEETPDGAIRAYLFAIGFTLVLVGGDMMAEKMDPRFYTGLVILALPVHLSWVFWKKLKPWFGASQLSDIGAIASSPRWWLGILFFLLAAAILSTFAEERWPFSGWFPVASGTITVHPSQTPVDPDWINKLKKVYKKSFHNERVPLDGYDYSDCQFTNVTLVYNGGYFSLTHNIFNDVIITSEILELQRMVNLVIQLSHSPVLQVPMTALNEK